MSASLGGDGARDPRHPETSRLASTSNYSWWPCWCNATPLQSPLVPAFIPGQSRLLVRIRIRHRPLQALLHQEPCLPAWKTEQVGCAALSAFQARLQFSLISGWMPPAVEQTCGH